MSPEITNVSEKVRAFRKDHPATEIGLLTSFTEDEVDGTPRVTGHCQAVLVASGALLAEAWGTRALRPPLPGRQGHQDTRDPDRAMTQAVGRCMGLLGYADGESLEGDTDEPDESNWTQVKSQRVESAQAEPSAASDTSRSNLPAAAPPAEPSSLIDRFGVKPVMDEVKKLTIERRKGERVPFKVEHLADVADGVLAEVARRLDAKLPV